MESKPIDCDIFRDYKSVTVWFQNKRQSSKRKAWTKSTRAKACVESEENKPHGNFVYDTVVKPQISLDCIASLFERPSHPTIHDNASKFQPPLTPRKTNHGDRAMSPASGSQLWTHMPSSPPESLSSPSADSFRFAMIHSPSRLMKSLEWACAKAREGRRQNKAKENRAPPRSLGKVPAMSPEAEMKSTRTNPKVASEEEETDTGTESDEAITPSTSMSSMRSSLFLEEIKHETRRKCAESAPEDMEAALVLLGFRK